MPAPANASTAPPATRAANPSRLCISCSPFGSFCQPPNLRGWTLSTRGDRSPPRQVVAAARGNAIVGPCRRANRKPWPRRRCPITCHRPSDARFASSRVSCHCGRRSPGTVSAYSVSPRGFTLRIWRPSSPFHSPSLTRRQFTAHSATSHSSSNRYRCGRFPSVISLRF